MIDRDSIITALKCCSSKDGQCGCCPFLNKEEHCNNLTEHALSVIAELEVENAKLANNCKKITRKREISKLHIKRLKLMSETYAIKYGNTTDCAEIINKVTSEILQNIIDDFTICFGTYSENDTIPIKKVFDALKELKKGMED